MLSEGNNLPNTASFDVGMALLYKHTYICTYICVYYGEHSTPPCTYIRRRVPTDTLQLTGYLSRRCLPNCQDTALSPSPAPSLPKSLVLTVYQVAASTSWNMELVASGESGRSRKGCVLKRELNDASGGMDFWCRGEVRLGLTFRISTSSGSGSLLEWEFNRYVRTYVYHMNINM